MLMSAKSILYQLGAKYYRVKFNNDYETSAIVIRSGSALLVVS